MKSLFVSSEQPAWTLFWSWRGFFCKTRVWTTGVSSDRRSLRRHVRGTDRSQGTTERPPVGPELPVLHNGWRMSTGATPNIDWDTWNTGVVEEFRANRGTILTGRFAGRRLVLLTTIGARSGQARTAPLAFTRSGDHYVVIASKAGSPSHPDWYHNLVRNPVVTLETGAETFQARARIAEGEERERLYTAQAALMPNFAEYQRRTARQIPVVVLERIS